MQEQEIYAIRDAARLKGLEFYQFMFVALAGADGISTRELFFKLYRKDPLSNRDLKTIHVRMHKIRAKLRDANVPWFIPTWRGHPDGFNRRPRWLYKLKRIELNEEEAQQVQASPQPALEEASRPAREADAGDQGVGNPQGPQG